MKKKPLHVKELAHGKSIENGQANWISAIATQINTDVIASGELLKENWKFGLRKHNRNVLFWLQDLVMVLYEFGN